MSRERPDPAEVYKAVRAHELMLNEAAAAQERSIVPPLLTLNGGAAVAFLTLLGALGRDSALKVDLGWATGAVGTWMVGLLLAAAAGLAAASRQKQINKGFRLMREQVEFAVFDEELAQIVVPPSPDHSGQDGVEVDRREGRAKASDAAGRSHTAYTLFWTTSALAFVIGGFLALNAVSTAADHADPNLPPGTPSQRLAPMPAPAVSLAATGARSVIRCEP